MAQHQVKSAGIDSAIGSVSSDGRVVLGQSVEIYPARPCEDYSAFEAQAFDAKDKRHGGEHFALICDRHLSPRVSEISAYKNLKSANISRLLEAGIVQWPLENRQMFVLVFEKPAGRKILRSMDETQVQKVSEDRLMTSLIQPFLSVLSEMKNTDFLHGAINPTNIFMQSAGTSENFTLGECISSAPSVSQHALFEPLARSMARPEGRGPGTSKDDLYAFGMCVAMLVRGENFVVGKSDRDIIFEKLEHGSFITAVGNSRLTGGISEFLRGVLNDDEGARWDVDEALKWAQGIHPPSRQPKPLLRAARPFVLMERTHWDLRSLSYALSEDVPAAAQTMEDDQFHLWIKRNFEDKTLAERVEKVWTEERTSGKDKLVSSMCMALDPPGPIRYRGVSFFPLGFGTALAEAISRQRDLQPYAEVISQHMAQNWVNYRFEQILDSSGIISLFEKCRSFLTQKNAGYGIERVLYLLNKDAVCMSPRLQDYFVMGPASLLLALDRMSRGAGRTEGVLDRHMIAFLAVRDPRVIDPNVGYIVSPDKGNQVVGIIRTLAAIQKNYNTGPVPGVTSWMASLVGPAIDRFNNRDLRQELSRQVGKLADKGDLAALLEFVANQGLVQDDFQLYTRAKQEYAALTREKLARQTQLKQRGRFGRASGRQAAMLISSLLSTFAIIGYVAIHVMRMLNGG